MVITIESFAKNSAQSVYIRINRLHCTEPHAGRQRRTKRTTSSMFPINAEQLIEVTDMRFFFCKTSNVNSSSMSPIMSTDFAPPLSSSVLCVCRIWFLHSIKHSMYRHTKGSVFTCFCRLKPSNCTFPVCKGNGDMCIVFVTWRLSTLTFLAPASCGQSPLCVLWHPHQICYMQLTLVCAACAQLGAQALPTTACRDVTGVAQHAGSYHNLKSYKTYSATVVF